MKTGLFGFDPATGGLEPLAEPPYDDPQIRMNDGRCDRQGRFWVSSMREPPDPEVQAGVLYRFDPDRRLHATVAGLVVGNGLAFSPNGRTLYHSDSHASVQTIWAWEMDPADGTIGNRRVLATTRDIAGRPDGAAVDQDGCYWTAANDGGQLVATRRGARWSARSSCRCAGRPCWRSAGASWT